MPRYASAQLRWSEQNQNYVLAVDNQDGTQALTSEWLEQHASFSFASRQGMHYTVRKQRVQRGSSYWYAYRRLHGRMVKRYLGKTADLTVDRLEEVAQLLDKIAPLQQGGVEKQAALLASSAPSVVDVEAIREAAPVATPPPIIFSKLAPPRLHAFLLERPHLFARIDAGREYPLTLISAPAGFGKTTLICQWIAARRSALPPVAWVSLEASDNDPLRFWRYLITACEAFQVELAQVQAALRALIPQPPFVPSVPSALETVLVALLNALARCPGQGILVLEDYHVITAQDIQATLVFFLEHLPPTFHLILITRSDPPFSLARLRAQNMLCEIRTTDLRFAQEETALLLHHALPFPLHASTIQQLHAQVQGWGAGLHLLQLALQRATTAAERELVFTLFAQNNTSIQEYFVSEVLALQPEPVQQFVLQTSLLPRLTSALCDAVTERRLGQDMLTLLERNNLFLEALDTTILHSSHTIQQWYRYHTLFAEAMRNEARRRFSEDQVRQMLTRASRWYEAHDLPQEAIEVSLAAQDYERAALLMMSTIEEHTFPGELYEPHTLQCWLEQLPETTLEQHPVLGLNYAITLLLQNTSWQPDASTLLVLEKFLSMAERNFRTQEQLPKLGELLAFRALLALRKGDTQLAISAAEQALDWLPQTHYLWRGLCLCVVGEKWIQEGDLRRAQSTFLEALVLCERVRNHFFKRVALVKLGQVRFEQGEIQQAASSFRQALAETQNEPTKMLVHWRCMALLGLATLCYEGNELETTEQHAQEAIAISRPRNLIHHEVHAMLILARVWQAQGQVFVAQQQLTALLDRIPASLFYLSQEVQTALAHLALTSGDHISAHRWVTAHMADCSQGGEEGLLVCRWLRIQGRLEEAAGHLERLLDAAQKKGHTRYILEIQVEMVLVAAARKHRDEAQRLLRQVLAHAFARNARRLFLDVGEQMAMLLRSLLPQLHDQTLLAYTRTLLSAFPDQQHPGQPAALVEPLSPQEMRVLHLLSQHRSNADIARELVVSVNTVRTQVQSIYGKLGVHKRSAVADIARDLHLL